MVKSNIKYIVVLLVVFILCILIFLSIDWIPPYAKTVNVMSSLKCRIELYAKTNNKLPDNLNDLPERRGYDNSIVDGWNRKIVYYYDNDSGEVSLISYGEKDEHQRKIDRDCIIKKFKVTFHR